MTKKKILIYGMSNNPGGMETYIHNMVDQLILDKYGFDLLTVFDDVADKEYFERKSINIYKITNFSINPLKHFLQLKSIINANKYYAIYLNLMDAGAYYTAKIAKMYGLKIIVHSHNDNCDRKLLHNMYKHKLSHISDLRLACSKRAGEFFFGKDIFYVIPNSFSFKRYLYNESDRQSIRNDYGFNNNDLVLLHIGRMKQQKNPLFLIDLFYNISRIYNNSYLIYIGDGDLKDKIVNRINQIDNKTGYVFSKHIKFIGTIDNNNIPKYLSSSDAFILPSNYEGLPFTLLEAQVNGLKCYISKNISDEVIISNKVKMLDINNPDYSARLVLNEFVDLQSNNSVDSFIVDYNRDISFNDSIYNIDNDGFKNILLNLLKDL